MAQIIDPVPPDDSELICCCYVNTSSKMQIARITNITNWYFERVVFPSQRLLFEALPAAQLEIHTGMMASAILSDTIPCTRLQLDNDDIVQSSYSAAEEQRLEDQNESYKPTVVKLRDPQDDLHHSESLKVPAAQR